MYRFLILFLLSFSSQAAFSDYGVRVHIKRGTKMPFSREQAVLLGSAVMEYANGDAKVEAIGKAILSYSRPVAFEATPELVYGNLYYYAGSIADDKDYLTAWYFAYAAWKISGEKEKYQERLLALTRAVPYHNLFGTVLDKRSKTKGTDKFSSTQANKESRSSRESENVNKIDFSFPALSGKGLDKKQLSDWGKFSLVEGELLNRKLQEEKSEMPVCALAREKGQAPSFQIKNMNVIVHENRHRKDTSVICFGSHSRSTKLAFQEALLAYKRRFPYLTGGFEVEFNLGEEGEKFWDDIDTGSVFLLLAAVLDGHQMDEKSICIADLAVNWNTVRLPAMPRRIMSVIENKKREIIIVPSENEAEVAELLLLLKSKRFSQIQILGAKTAGDLLSMSSSQRSANTQLAIDKFTAFKKMCSKDSSLIKSKKKVHGYMVDILKLCPNHLSAKALLSYAEGGAPTRLSIRSSIEELEFYSQLFIGKRPGEIPESTIRDVQKKLLRLHPRLNKKVSFMYSTLSRFVQNTLRASSSLINRERHNNTAVKSFDAFSSEWERVMDSQLVLENIY